MFAIVATLAQKVKTGTLLSGEAGENIVFKCMRLERPAASMIPSARVHAHAEKRLIHAEEPAKALFGESAKGFFGKLPFVRRDGLRRPVGVRHGDEDVLSPAFSLKHGSEGASPFGGLHGFVFNIHGEKRELHGLFVVGADEDAHRIVLDGVSCKNGSRQQGRPVGKGRQDGERRKALLVQKRLVPLGIEAGEPAPELGRHGGIGRPNSRRANDGLDGPIPAHAVGCDQDGRLSGG